MMSPDQLVSRAALDALNSIRVARGIVTWRIERPLTRRLLDGFTGEESRRQAALDGHVTSALGGLQGLLEIVRENATQSDIVLLRTIKTLTVVRDQTDTTERRLGRLQRDVAKLHETVELELGQLRRDVNVALAKHDVEDVFARLREDIAPGELSLAHLWQAADTLWWGPFGVVIRQAPNDRAAEELRDRFTRATGDLLRAHGLGEAVTVTPLAGRIEILPPDELEVLELAALDPAWRLRPITRTIVERSRGVEDEQEERLRLPVVSTARNLGVQILNETVRGTEPS